MTLAAEYCIIYLLNKYPALETLPTPTPTFSLFTVNFNKENFLLKIKKKNFYLFILELSNSIISIVVKSMTLVT